MMPDLSIVLTAFLLGLLGSLHCAGMCGGIIGVLHGAQKISPKPSIQNTVLISLAFNAGRIMSYAIAGAIASLFGYSLLGLLGAEIGGMMMKMLAGFFLILLGLYLSSWWNGLSLVEKIGQKLWAKIQPFTRAFLPINSYKDAVIVGAFWGWLPCGLVYSALILIMTSGSPVTGALGMAAFGLGTLPMTASLGFASQRAKFAQSPTVRRAAGVLVIIFGVMMFTGLSMNHVMAGHGANHEAKLPIQNNIPKAQK